MTNDASITASSESQPIPEELGRVESYADILPCVIPDRSATYVSVPITSGRRFIEWYRMRGHELDPMSDAYRDEHRRAVIVPNCEAARERVGELRRALSSIIIEPTAFERPEWNQDQYRYFWGVVIQRFVRQVVFLDGWEFSSGCSYEFLMATRAGCQTVASNLDRLSAANGAAHLEAAIGAMSAQGLKTTFLQSVLRELQSEVTRSAGELPLPPNEVVVTAVEGAKRLHFKDAVLNSLAEIGNVAQFVSFKSDAALTQRYSRVAGREPNHMFPSASEAIVELLQRASDGAVNVRSFHPEQPKGEPLVYGLKTVDDVSTILRQKASEGKYTIVNETIDVNDGGVSGVALGRVVEFAPFDTPKCVDKPGVCSLPRGLGLQLLTAVYGFRPALDFGPRFRVEFSVHPRERGLRHAHTILWEIEEVGPSAEEAEPAFVWPNEFSKMLGDKVFGLLVADGLELPVPRTTVITRAVAPFTFGRQTGTLEWWIRTAPAVRYPGAYATYYGWRDPFKLVQSEEARVAGRVDSIPIASVIAQQSVRFLFSGALKDKEPEGVKGAGDMFMMGKSAPQQLPQEVVEAVLALRSRVAGLVGPVEFEWVFDGELAWVLQLHREEKIHRVAPTATKYVRFDVSEGLDHLRLLLNRVKNDPTGVILVGDVGISSHFGDLLRAAGVSWHIERPKAT